MLQQHSLDGTTIFTSPCSSYYTWVHSTSADHTSCPYSFTFFTCLLNSGSVRLIFSGIRQKYLAQDIRRHLASIYRQYDDVKLIVRDRAKCNINSVNFPEFSRTVNAENQAAAGPDSRKQRLKTDLLWVVEYERRWFDLTAKEL